MHPPRVNRLSADESQGGRVRRVDGLELEQVALQRVQRVSLEGGDGSGDWHRLGLLHQSGVLLRVALAVAWFEEIQRLVDPGLGGRGGDSEHQRNASHVRWTWCQRAVTGRQSPLRYLNYKVDNGMSFRFGFGFMYLFWHFGETLIWPKWPFLAEVAYFDQKFCPNYCISVFRLSTRITQDGWINCLTCSTRFFLASVM